MTMKMDESMGNFSLFGGYSPPAVTASAAFGTGAFATRQLGSAHCEAAARLSDDGEDGRGARRRRPHVSAVRRRRRRLAWRLPYAPQPGPRALGWSNVAVPQLCSCTSSVCAWRLGTASDGRASRLQSSPFHRVRACRCSRTAGGSTAASGSTASQHGQIAPLAVHQLGSCASSGHA